MSITLATPPAPVPPPAPAQTRTLSYPVPKVLFRKSRISSYLVRNTSSAASGFLPAPPSPIKSLFCSGILIKDRSCFAVFITPTLRYPKFQKDSANLEPPWPTPTMAKLKAASSKVSLIASSICSSSGRGISGKSIPKSSTPKLSTGAGGASSGVGAGASPAVKDAGGSSPGKGVSFSLFG